MPSRERVLALVAMVEQGKYVEAIEEFYTQDATTIRREAGARFWSPARERFLRRTRACVRSRALRSCWTATGW
jgi:hypothetical protein